jgi:broad-specificity NMP kinase
MSADWQNKEAQMRHTAEYMANEYKNEAANVKLQYSQLREMINELIDAIPKDRILWHQDVNDLIDKLKQKMEDDNVR